ncbi:MAG: InlB B-repeat-containing protein [Chitinispirillia bacterium]|nr:InlB B-repeat-containing protein [Chitinispirillia bacterium]
MKKRILHKAFALAAVAVSVTITIFTACDGFFGPIGPPEREQYTVSYRLNNGGGSTPSSHTVNAGNCITLSYGSNLSRSGYTFSGWNTNSSGTGTNYSAGDLICPSGNMTLYARWTVIQYTVSYNLNGGSGTAPSSQSVNAGSCVTLNYGGGLSRSGYTFAGWNTSSSGTGTEYSAGGSICPSGSVTLYARWTQNPVTTYYVYYDLNGGSGSTPSSHSVNAGNCVTLSYGGNFSRSGYTFAGWNTSSSGTGSNYSEGYSYCPSGSVTLYARWVQNATTTYYVYYELNGGSGTTPSSQSVNAGNCVTLNSGSGFSRNGYTFAGWSTSSSGGGSNYSAGGSICPSGSVTLYARWTQNANTTYTVNYNMNGGDGTTPSPQSVSSGSCVTLNYGSGFSRSGYTFDGWNTSSSGTGSNYSAGYSFCPSGNITLYAKWIQNAVPTYTVSYSMNGGSGTTPQSQSVNAGNSVTLASGSGLTRSGHTFTGWNTNSAGTGNNYGAGISFTPTGNITLYARWTATVSGGESGTFVDGRDSKSYKWVKIGTQTWMAENLNYNVSGSVCYNNSSSNCDIYGRLYDWATVMGIDAAYNDIWWYGGDINHQGICPAGWHVPSDDEWETLVKYVDPNASGDYSNNAGTKLKSTTGWSGGGNGTDDHGFSALPGGNRWGGSFDNAGSGGYWWSATEYGASNAWFRDIYGYYDLVNRGNYSNKTDLFSLRCVRD